jgi:GNAT superfamily N-acetyltransferase
MTSGIDVRPVADARGLDAFLQVPFTVFRGDPNWIAPLFFERREHLDRKKNPYFAHAEAQLFVAFKEGEPAGRISAQIDRLRLERYRDQTGQFGFLDAIDDREIFHLLVAAAGDWLKSRGMATIQGPFSFSINDETGLLVDGFATPPVMMMGHARPYYAAHLDALGFAKAKDVIAYDYDARPPLPRAMQAMVDKARASGDMTVRAFRKKELAQDLAIIIDIFNDAWSENWGFVPMTEAEIRALGNNLKLLVSEDYIAIVEYRGRPAAMAVSLPDINGWIKDLNGRLLPFGWAKLAWRSLMRPPARVRIPLMGVRKEYHGRAIGSALAAAAIDRVRNCHIARGCERAELSWILEDNLAMRRMIEAIGGIAYKTYRVYQKPIA